MGMHLKSRIKRLGPEASAQKTPDLINNERGIALLLVLWVLAFLMFMVIEFAYTMRVETDTVRNLKDETAARYLAFAGINMGLAELGANYDIVFRNNKGEVTLGKQEAHDIQTITVSRDFNLGEGHVRYHIDDEEGKLNINTATREQIKELLLLTGVETTTRDVIADSILDWRDKNHAFHFNGAEDEYYGSLEEPYGAKDGQFDTTEELLLLKGVTPAIFYGDGNIPYEMRANLQSKSYGAEPAYKGLAPYITVVGEGRINLNTADATVLDAVFGKGKSMEIMLRRETEGLLDWPKYGGGITSRDFTIHAEGEVRGMKVMVKAIAVRVPERSDPLVVYWEDEAQALN